MKTIIIMMMLLLGSISYSQEDSLSDIEIRDAMIEGAWFHAGTIYTANDSVDTYYILAKYNGSRIACAIILPLQLNAGSTA